jgi:hypothetical protein
MNQRLKLRAPAFLRRFAIEDIGCCECTNPSCTIREEGLVGYLSVDPKDARAGWICINRYGLFATVASSAIERWLNCDIADMGTSALMLGRV